MPIEPRFEDLPATASWLRDFADEASYGLRTSGNTYFHCHSNTPVALLRALWCCWKRGARIHVTTGLTARATGIQRRSWGAEFQPGRVTLFPVAQIGQLFINSSRSLRFRYVRGRDEFVRIPEIVRIRFLGPYGPGGVDVYRDPDYFHLPLEARLRSDQQPGVAVYYGDCAKALKSFPTLRGAETFAAYYDIPLLVDPALRPPAPAPAWQPAVRALTLRPKLR